jgi:hypothetical protein
MLTRNLKEDELMKKIKMIEGINWKDVKVGDVHETLAQVEKLLSAVLSAYEQNKKSEYLYWLNIIICVVMK